MTKLSAARLPEWPSAVQQKDPTAPKPASIQAAAIAFLARANGDRAPCVRVAGGPDELTQGRVTGQLLDPPPDLVMDLSSQGMTGVTVRAFSACTAADRDHVAYAIGWPRSTAKGFEVNADRLCGVRRGEGNLAVVKQLGTVWRAVEVEATLEVVSVTNKRMPR